MELEKESKVLHLFLRKQELNCDIRCRLSIGDLKVHLGSDILSPIRP